MTAALWMTVETAQRDRWFFSMGLVELVGGLDVKADRPCPVLHHALRRSHTIEPARPTAAAQQRPAIHARTPACSSAAALRSPTPCRFNLDPPQPRLHVDIGFRSRVLL
jgi:hypothetical protein